MEAGVPEVEEEEEPVVEGEVVPEGEPVEEVEKKKKKKIDPGSPYRTVLCVWACVLPIPQPQQMRELGIRVLSPPKK